MGWEGVDSIHLVQDGDQWRDLLNMAMNFQVSYKIRNFLTSWVIISYSKRTLLQSYMCKSLFIMWHVIQG